MRRKEIAQLVLIMKTSNPNPASSHPLTLEQTIAAKVDGCRLSAEECLREAENYVRQEPVKAVAFAVAAGYLLRLLPVAAILRTIIALVLASLRPAVLSYAAAKAYELFRRSNSAGRLNGL
jgi:hypothetical protein